MEYYEKFNRLREVLSDETVFTEILNYFSSHDIEEFCWSVARDYEVEYELDNY